MDAKWSWVSIRPGNRVKLDRSISSVPGGSETAALGPTSVIRSPSINTVESFRIGPPVPSIRSAPSNAFISYLVLLIVVLVCLKMGQMLVKATGGVKLYNSIGFHLIRLTDQGQMEPGLDIIRGYGHCPTEFFSNLEFMVMGNGWTDKLGCIDVGGAVRCRLRFGP